MLLVVFLCIIVSSLLFSSLFPRYGNRASILWNGCVCNIQCQIHERIFAEDVCKKLDCRPPESDIGFFFSSHNVFVMARFLEQLGGKNDNGPYTGKKSRKKRAIFDESRLYPDRKRHSILSIARGPPAR